MQFTMSANTHGYVSVGFGETYGLMSPADVYAGWVNADGEPVISDRKNVRVRGTRVQAHRNTE